MEIKHTLDAGKWRASLRINGRKGEITWCFPGPDRRYNPQFMYTPMKHVPAMAEAVIHGWRMLERLSTRATPSMEIREELTLGRHYFHVVAGGRFPGIYPWPRVINASSCPIGTAEERDTFRASSTERLPLRPPSEVIGSHTEGTSEVGRRRVR